MTNVKAQIPNECQMTNAKQIITKARNFESTKVEKICEPSFDIHNSLFDIYPPILCGGFNIYPPLLWRVRFSN
jgi:hypothetical protein